MATVAQKIDALTAQVAELTEQVRRLTQTRMTMEATFEVGVICGEEQARAAMLGKATASRAPGPPKSRRLQSV